MIFFSNQHRERLKLKWKQSTFVNHRFSVLSWRVFKELGDDDATHLAAGVAYYAMFGLFPLILAVLAIGGVLLNTTERQENFVNFVTDNLPGSKGFVEDNLREVIRYRSALGIAAIAGLLWSASAGMGAVARGVNRAWDVHRNRPFYVAKPLQIMMALAVGVLFLLSTFLTSAIEVITDPRRNWSLPGQDILLDMGIANLALRIAPLLINMAIFLLLYYFAPNCKTYWRYVWPGALVAAILFEIAKGIFIWYLDNLATYDQVYGSVTSVMSLLLWMWVSALILILGAEISSEYGRMKEGVDRGQLIHPLSVKE